MASHRGSDAIQEKKSERFFWHNIKNDFERFIKKCNHDQKQLEIKKESTELHSVRVEREVIQPIVIDIYILPKLDGLKA